MRPLLYLAVSLAVATFHQATGQSKSVPKVTDATFEQIVERLEAMADELHVSGMGLAIVTPEGSFTRGLGVRSLDGPKATSDTLYEIGSTTKSFTGVLTAILKEQDLLSYDDSVQKHVPYFQLKDEEANKNVTIRDLLSHQTGLTRTDVILGGGDNLTIRDVIEQLAEAEPLAPFRSAFLYNNQMFLVAGTACEAAGGASYEDLLQEFIFKPLGMDDSTSVLENVHDDERLSSGYRWMEGDEKLEHVPTLGIKSSAPAGSILSTPDDMAKYIRFLLNKGKAEDGTEILPESAFDDLWGTQRAIAPTAGYGLGFMLNEWQGHKMIDHGGNIDGFTSQMAILPDLGIGFSMVANLSMTSAQQKCVDIIFGTLLGEDVAEDIDDALDEDNALTEDELNPYKGRFVLEVDPDQKWAVDINDAGQLTLEIPGQPALALNWPNEDDRWTLAAAPEVSVAFHKNDTGGVEALTFYRPEVELKATRMPENTGLPSAEDILQLTGKAIPEEAIAAAAPLKILGEVQLVHQGLTGQYTMQYQDASHWRLDLDFGKFGRITTVLNGQSGWSFAPLQGHKDLSETERSESIQSAPFSTLLTTREFYKSFQVIDKTGEGESERTQLLAIPKHGEKVTFHINTEGDVREIDTGISLGDLGAIPLKIELSDYEVMHGMRVAKKTKTSNPFTGVSRMTIKALETNVSIPDSIWKKDE